MIINTNIKIGVSEDLLHCYCCEFSFVSSGCKYDSYYCELFIDNDNEMIILDYDKEVKKTFRCKQCLDSIVVE